MHNIYGGGSQTIVNGLNFEKETDLKNALEEKGFSVTNNQVYYKNNQIGMYLPKNSLYKYLEKQGIDYTDILSKKLLPDECIYDFNSETFIILEKKYQKTVGSVDEELQTCDFKLKQYKKLLKSLNVNVEYIYIFNNWFEQKQYDDVKEYIKSVGCDYYFSEISINKIFSHININ